MSTPESTPGSSTPPPDSRAIRVLDIVNVRGLWVITLALGLWGVIDGVRLGFGSLESPGPGLWPIVLGAPTVLFSLILALRGGPKGDLPDDTADDEEAGNTAWAWSVMAILVLITAILPWAGLYLGIGLFCLISARLVSQLDWWRTTAITLATPIACYLIFEVGLSVRIPWGILGMLNLF